MSQSSYVIYPPALTVSQSEYITYPPKVIYPSGNSGGSGTFNHDELLQLSWEESGHIGLEEGVAGFDENGNATVYLFDSDIQPYNSNLQAISEIELEGLLLSTGPGVWGTLDTSIEGTLIFRGATGWEVLTPGTSGQYLQTQGVGSQPIWTTVSGSGLGDVVGPASSTDNAIVRFDLATGKLVQNSVVIISDTGNLTGIVDLTMSGSLNINAGELLIPIDGSPPITNSALTWNGSTLYISNGVSALPIAFKSEVDDHDSRHILSGLDEIDADQLGIDYIPTNYTRDNTPIIVSDNKHLTSHLAGIDNALASITTNNWFGGW